jgi:CRP-like cAMP-binding protein
MEREFAITAFRKYLEKFITIKNEEFAAAEKYFKIQLLKKGEKFIAEGSVGRYMGFIAEGFMRSYLIHDNREITTCLCNENNIASSSASLFSQMPSNTTIEAVDKSTLLIISQADLLELYKKFPFWSEVGRILAEKEFMHLDCRIHCYGIKDAENKYIELIKDQPWLLQRAPLRYIASYLDIAPETLSRIRKKISHKIS